MSASRRNSTTSSDGLPDIMEEVVIKCPHPHYARLREERPVYYYERGGFWVVSKMEDVKSVASNPGVFSSNTLDAIGFTPKTREVLFPEATLIFSDESQHTRTRALVARAFTAPRVNAMESRIQMLVDELFDTFIDHGTVEFMEELAMPLPVYIIADQMGVPRKDFQKFRMWSNAISESANPGRTPEEKESLYYRPAKDFNDYMLERRAEKIAHPTEDIISMLARATPQVGEKESETFAPFTDSEFLAITQILLTAGNETTTAGILSMLLRLCDPALFSKIKADKRLIQSLVEEVLRLEAPVQGFYRCVTEDTELGGVNLSKGAFVHVRFGSANRDGNAFVAPDEFDLARRASRAHVAFGFGIHNCVGQMLARKEMACVAKSLVERLTSMEVKAGTTPRYLNMFNRRSLEELHVDFTRVS